MLEAVSASAQLITLLAHQLTLSHSYELGRHNGWCEPRPPALAGETHLNHQHHREHDAAQKRKGGRRLHTVLGGMAGKLESANKEHNTCNY